MRLNESGENVQYISRDFPVLKNIFMYFLVSKNIYEFRLFPLSSLNMMIINLSLIKLV